MLGGCERTGHCLDDDAQYQGAREASDALQRQPVVEVAPEYLLRQVQEHVEAHVRDQEVHVHDHEQGRAEAAHQDEQSAVQQHAEEHDGPLRAPVRKVA